MDNQKDLLPIASNIDINEIATGSIVQNEVQSSTIYKEDTLSTCDVLIKTTTEVTKDELGKIEDKFGSTNSQTNEDQNRQTEEELNSQTNEDPNRQTDEELNRQTDEELSATTYGTNDENTQQSTKDKNSLIGEETSDVRPSDTSNNDDSESDEVSPFTEEESFVSGFDETTLASSSDLEESEEGTTQEVKLLDDEESEFVSTKGFVVDNIDDSQLLADEVGVSGVYDTFGREILDPVFENQLRLSKNSIKLAYSRLKNAVLTYREVKQRYSGTQEHFKKSNKILCRMEIGENCLNIFYALNYDELNSESFVFHSAKGLYKQTPVRVTISKGDEKSGEEYLTAMSFVEKVMAENGIEKNKTYVPIAYAERYPFNPYAVLSGKEEIAPTVDAIEDIEYDYIEGELSRNIIEELMGESFKLDDKQGKDKLVALRQQASTIKGAVAITEPIIYFYDSALTRENVNAYLNMQQVLQDKFLGKMLPQQYFAIAESSSRVEQLNFLAVKEAVQSCDENPKYNFCVKISCRLLTKGNAFERLVKYSKTENNNLIMAFDCALLEVLGLDGMQAIEKLKENGIKIMLDNTESAGLKILTEYIIDYLRFDARYYKEDNLRTTAHLDMLTSYCKVQGIATTSTNVDSNKEAKYFMTHGVDIIQGFVIEEPKRTIAGAVKEVRKLASVGN